MKIIIAGAGIGGMALAALLHQRGVTAELYERAPNFDHSGYMLGLYPVGTRVLHGLDLMEDFLAASESMATYTVCNGHGQEIHTYALGEMLDQFGYSGGIMRGELLALLRTRCADVPLHFGTSVTDFEETKDRVTVRLSDGTENACDLLVGADGIHSAVRRKLFGEAPDHDTGWGCWVWVVRNTKRPPTAVRENWGAGRFLGVYPIKGGLGVVAAGPTRMVGPDAVGRDGRKVKAHFSALGSSVADLMAVLPDDLGDTFWWKLSDFRSKEWGKGRVALLGDAACAFLPTAGVGASMALESAAVLDDELGRTDARFLAGALARYESRRKPRAETFQEDSRRLGSMMMIESVELSWGRDQLMKFYTLDMLAKNIAQSLAKPI
ncbi:MAG: NAD(P)/FAD-dependent oxidoreductase [Reyranella sp.]|uniref:FAD-dependent oxidoreductase n=1 Tax=Reyranella sp. TaxID=1929291 RepID=UPI002731A075|nr:NAD(P)/FAD-dependent oxidoreductase [Reyranella sp.]MDP1962036.1 NAD(P)/FAD-dependent oxidoreductase [Reyranella sp.]MDP2377858.1 NAD(P)/FAD-dependent oxidoreductase [Reyranella sp.]